MGNDLYIRQDDQAESTLTRILNEWGISPKVAWRFGWRLSKNNLIIFESKPDYRKRVMRTPVFDEAHEDNGLVKIFWDKYTQDLDMPTLYNDQALKGGHDFIYIANGEKATLAMVSAGIENVVCTFGEGVKIKQAVTELVEAGVTHIRVLADYDEAGMKAAYRWAVTGMNNNIKVDVLDIGRTMRELFQLETEAVRKWDIRDVWLFLQQVPKELQSFLELTLPVDFTLYKDWLGKLLEQESVPRYPRQAIPKYHPGNARPVAAIGHLRLYDDWKELIKETLETQSPSPKGPGVHHERHCPLGTHPDENPSFRIGDRTPQCSCDVQHGPNPWQTLAVALGLPEYGDYKKQRLKEYYAVVSKARKKEEARKADITVVEEHNDPYRFAHGIPNVVRTHILSMHRAGTVQNQGAALIVWEVWHASGVRGNKRFTAYDIVKWGAERDVRYKQALKGIRQLQALGFVKKAAKVNTALGRPRDGYRFVQLKKAMPTFIDVVLYNKREFLFRDYPDVVSDEWFPKHTKKKYPEHVTRMLIEFENVIRHSVYEQHEEEILKRIEEYKEFETRVFDELESDDLIYRHSHNIQEGLVWSNTSRYRETYYLELAEERIINQQPITRTKASDEIGVCPKTLSDIRRRVGIMTDKRFKDIKLDSAPAAIDQIYNFAPWAAESDYGPWVVVEDEEGRRIKECNIAYYRKSPKGINFINKIVKDGLKNGHKAMLRIQTASQERYPKTREEQLHLEYLEAEERRKDRELARRKREEGLYLDYVERPECVTRGHTKWYLQEQYDKYTKSQKPKTYHQIRRAIVTSDCSSTLRDFLPNLPPLTRLYCIEGIFGNKPLPRAPLEEAIQWFGLAARVT